MCLSNLISSHHVQCHGIFTHIIHFMENTCWGWWNTHFEPGSQAVKILYSCILEAIATTNTWKKNNQFLEIINIQNIQDTENNTLNDNKKHPVDIVYTSCSLANHNIGSLHVQSVTCYQTIQQKIHIKYNYEIMSVCD